VRLHGVPEAVISDRDVRFKNNEVLESICQHLGTDVRLTQPIYHEADGQTARVNSVS